MHHTGKYVSPFCKAAHKSEVTQPTLSMMIQKLEEELCIKIFDRNTKPVTPTREGKEIILRPKQILTDVARIKEFATELREEILGALHLGLFRLLLLICCRCFLSPLPKIARTLGSTLRK
ncbi:MAG: LysR family transcriptional regulator [Chitinophagales bacterium]